MKIKNRPDDASMVQLDEWLAELREDDRAEPDPRGDRVTAAPRPRVTAAPRPRVTAAPRPRATAAPRPRVTAAPRPRATTAPRPRASLIMGQPSPPPGLWCGP